MTAKDNKPDLDEMIDKGLELLEKQGSEFETRKEFLDLVKRHGLAIWHALVGFILRDPHEIKKYKDDTMPRK
ncbi:MAG: hypothetical protein GF375_02385 [Candidatus Omnitrophica bacterium]|nr:hypothetical protein [Candidatus Omnitrophota bacterium]